MFDFPSGATPISDASDLIPTWVHQKQDLNRIESENIFKAQKKYFRTKVQDPKIWFHIPELRKIHKSMFQDVWKWAGKYRKSITSIGILPKWIPFKLAEFCAEVATWLNDPVELTFLEMAARIHHRLVFIHPFENGNGRFSRFISDLFLIALNCRYPSWPTQLNKNGNFRDEYIEALKCGDKGNYIPLLNFMKQFGATDPKLTELLKNKIYKDYVNGQKGISLLKAYVRNHANPNEETPDGHRLLQIAVKSGLEEFVQFLLTIGAEINYIDKSGLTPFQLAVQEENKSLVTLLLKMGAKKQLPPGKDASKYTKLLI